MRAIIWIMCSSIVVCGQSTTDAPKRTLFDSKGATLKKPEPPAADVAKPRETAAPENARGASERALDSLGTSTENLNEIRDSNVRRLTGDGCAPEVSARIADLRTRLQMATGAPDVAVKSSNVREDSGSATLAMASNWFKSGSAGSSLIAKDKSNELLDSVLPDSPARKPADSRAEYRDAAGLKSEIEHLLATCPGAKR